MSAHLLRYQHVKGQTRTFEQRVHLIIEPPDAEAVADQGETACAVTVTQVDADAVATIEVHASVTQPTATPGALGEERATFQMNDRGELLDAAPRPPVIPVVTFPDAPVAARETWKTVESSGPRRLSMEHTVGTYEPVGDDIYAHVATVGSSAGDPAIELQAVRVFSVAHGHWVLGRSVVKYIAADGRVSTLVVEETLRGL